MQNQLVILCGGRATRLQEISKDVAKSMLPVLGQPFLEYLLRRISVLPFDEIVLLAGHLGQQVYEKFHNRYYNGVLVRVVIEREPKGTLYAFHQIKDELAENIWICNGDTFFDYQDILKFRDVFSDKTDFSYLFSSEVSDTSRYGSISHSCDHIIEEFNEKSDDSGPGLISSGLAKIKRECLLNALQKDGVSLEYDLLRVLACERRLKVVNNAISNFIDFGVPKDYNILAEKVLLSFPTKAIFWDRDGTLNQDLGYTHKASDYQLMPYLHDTTNAFTNSKVLNFIVTNQSGIARGLYGLSDVYLFHKKMKDDFLKRGWIIDDIILCPHHVKGLVEELAVNCQCRKPQIGMFQELLQKWNISSDKTKFIGNTDSDMEAASRLNIPYLSVNEDDFNLQSLERFIRC